MKIQVWNVRRLLFLTGLLLAFLCVPAKALAGEKAGKITDFDIVSDSCIRLSDHIPLEELKEKMPREISVYLDGAKSPVRIPADWVSDVDYDSTYESYYLFMAQWDQEKYPLAPDYNEQGYLPFVEVEVRDGGQPASIAAASGVSNIVQRAYQQVDIAWTPLKQVKGYIGLNGSLTTTYYPGVTYRGMPYGQLVDSGKYVPHNATFDTFLEAVKNPNSVFYTARGSYMSRNSTYYGNDCSAFVSYAYGLPRMTTGMIGASSQFTKVPLNNIYNAQVGDCFNKYTSHVELITGMLYNDKGILVTVEVCEQTPPKARRVRYTPAQVQSIIDSGYVLLRYNGRNNVRPPYYYNGYAAKTDSLAYIGDGFFASIVNKESGKNAANDGAGNVCAQAGDESAGQVWYFEAQDDGTYIITSCKDGKAMGIQNYGSANGTNIVTDNYAGSSAQRWYVYRSEGKYKLVAANGNSVLNLSDGKNMTIWEDNDAGTQGFEIKTLNRKGSVHMAEVTLGEYSYVYDGKAKKPGTTVKIGTTKLKKGTDYKAAYSENVEAGTAKVTITGIGEYTGEIIQEFTIQKASQDLQVTLSAEAGKEGDVLEITTAGEKTDLKFSSDDKTVAKVNQKGKVTCLKAGTALISIEAESSSNYEAAVRTVSVRVEHDYLAEVTDPTCVDQGYTTYTCRGCGDVYVSDYKEALGHTDDGTGTVEEPTCTEDGIKNCICSVCGEAFEEVLPALGHAYGSWIINHDGTHTRVCANDPEHVETEDCTYKYELIQKADGNQEGILGYRCTVCGYYFTKNISAEECIHEITETRNKADASCETNGYTGDVVCEICGKMIEQGSVIPAAGHTWDSGTVTKEPAIGKEGVRKFVCEICKKTRKETIEALKNPLVPGSLKKDSVSGGIYKIGKDRVSVSYNGPTSANKKNASIVIPNTVKLEGVSCKVTAISAEAFKDNKKLQQVTIGKNVQDIGIGAFQNCVKLAVVSGGKGVKLIRKDAFNGCTGLGKITLGPEVTMIGNRAFRGCLALTRITLQEKVSSVGVQAFYGCSGLKKLTIKTSALKDKTTGANAFRGIGGNAVAVVPQKALSRYTRLLKAKGLEGRVSSNG